MKKTILITGSSTGIGREIAIFFAQKGWQVAATMRTPEKGQDLLQYPNIKIFKLDVTDEATIKTAIEETLVAFGGIDVVVNNAGYALAGVFEAMTHEQIKKQFDTNLFGAMNVIKAILPYFRSRKCGMIINISSAAGLLTFPLYTAYHSTKWALEGFLESLQFELRQFNIKIKIIEPGMIKTGFEDAIEFVSVQAYDAYAQTIHDHMMNIYKLSSEPLDVAQKVWRVAHDDSSRLRYVVGGFAPFMVFMRKIMPLSWFLAMVRLIIEKGSKHTRR